MNWKQAEDTLQEVGMFLLAMDNAEGLRKGLPQPDRKPSPLTQKVFALMKEVRGRRLIPPKNNFRRALNEKTGVPHVLTRSGRIVCGTPLENHIIIGGEIHDGDCRKCLGILKKLGII